MDRLTAAHVFVTIAQRGSLTGAADALDMSRAMVTRYLAEMEAWVGARLFHRNTRRIALTAAGESALVQSKALLALSDQLPMGASEGDHRLQGMLRVACAQSLSQAVLAPMVARFLAEHPQVTIDLHVTEQTVDLVAERIDLSIRISNALSPALIARRLGTCHSVICAAPSYLATHGHPADVTDLGQHNCLTYAYFGASLWRFTVGEGGEVSVPVRGNLSANDSMTLLRATVAGLGISMQPRYAVKPHLAQGELVALVPHALPEPLGIQGVYTSKAHQSMLMRTFLDHLVEAFAQVDALA